LLINDKVVTSFGDRQNAHGNPGPLNNSAACSMHKNQHASTMHLQLMVDREPPTVPSVPEAPELQSLLQSCLDLDHSARPTAGHVVQVCLPAGSMFGGLFTLGKTQPVHTPENMHCKSLTLRTSYL